MGLLRFYLAYSVLIGHSDHGLGLPGLHTTVAVESFYIISGFYMALVLNGKYADKPYFVFMRSRYLRLYFVYVAVLALTIFYGAATYAMKGTVEWPFQAWARTLDRLDFGTLLALASSNLFIFGQDWLMLFRVGSSGVLESNIAHAAPIGDFTGYALIPQAWTLGLELTFYLLAPFLARKNAGLILSLIAVGLLLKYAVFPAVGLPYEPFGYHFFPFELPLFLLGMLSFKLYRRLQTVPPGLGMRSTSLVLLVSVYANPYLDLGMWPRYLLLALTIPFTFYIFKRNKIDRWIGELSYPMYLSHLLIFNGLNQFTSLHTETWGTSLTIILSIGLFLFIEKPGDAFRQRLNAQSPKISIPGKWKLAVCAAVLIVIAAPFAVKQEILASLETRSLSIGSYDLMRDYPEKMVTVGLDSIETNEFGTWRWALSEKSEMIFSLAREKTLLLTLKYVAIMPDQEVSIFFNGVKMETIRGNEGGEAVFRVFSLPGRHGDNVIRFVYSAWNKKNRLLIPGAERPLAVRFTVLQLEG